MFSPLSGVRVLDLSHLLAGPYCSYLMAMMGAEVIKVENPEGEWTRGHGSDFARNAAGMGMSYLAQNAGKRSITINLKHARGVELVKKLAASSDVFLENMRPGVMERLGLGHEAIMRVNPRIVYCSLSGFGQHGPLSHRPAYDHVIQAMCGFMSVNGYPDGDPVKVGAPFIDYASGVNAALAVVSALHQVRRTGQGCRLDVAMLDSVLNLLTSHIVEYVNAGTVPRRIGNDAPSGVATAGAFNTSDGPLLIGANAAAHFAPLARAIGAAELLQDPRFATPALREENRDALRQAISAALAHRSAAEWETLLDAAGVPAARPRTIPEIVDDPPVVGRGVVQNVAIAPGQPALGLTSRGWQVDGRPIGPHGAPPTLGADTDSVLRECGLADAEIASLRADGAL